MNNCTRKMGHFKVPKNAHYCTYTCMMSDRVKITEHNNKIVDNETKRYES